MTENTRILLGKLNTVLMKMQTDIAVSLLESAIVQVEDVIRIKARKKVDDLKEYMK